MDAITTLVKKHHAPAGQYRIYNNGMQTCLCPETDQEYVILLGVPDATLPQLALPCPIDETYAFCAVDDDLVADSLHHLIVSAIVKYCMY